MCQDDLKRNPEESIACDMCSVGHTLACPCPASASVAALRAALVPHVREVLSLRSLAGEDCTSRQQAAAKSKNAMPVSKPLKL
jgi:hypothetical protein